MVDQDDLGDALPDGSSPSVEPQEGLDAAHSIPIAKLEQFRRKICRRFAAAIVSAMAETDSSIDDIAARLNKHPKLIRSWLRQLVDGNDPGSGLCWVADMATAMDCEIEFRILPLGETGQS